MSLTIYILHMNNTTPPAVCVTEYTNLIDTYLATRPREFYDNLASVVTAIDKHLHDYDASPLNVDPRVTDGLNSYDYAAEAIVASCALNYLRRTHDDMLKLPLPPIKF